MNENDCKIYYNSLILINKICNLSKLKPDKIEDWPILARNAVELIRCETEKVLKLPK